MTPLPTSSRRLQSGWLQLAQALTGAADRRRPAFAMTEPVVFRSECFAEDLEEPPLLRLAHPPRNI